MKFFVNNGRSALLLFQWLSAALAFLLSLQGLTEVAAGSTIGALKAAVCPLVWLYLARKLNSFYPSCFLLLGGIFIAVVLMPGITLPAAFESENGAFVAVVLGSFLALNLWSAYHARWAQIRWFSQRPTS